jgi:ATP-dependent protease ClpP protease subunit
MKTWVSALCIVLSIFQVNANTYVPPTKLNFALHVVSKKAGINITTRKVTHVIGHISESSVRASIQETLETMYMVGDRVVYIDSGGGDAVAGLRLINALMVERAAGTRLICVAVKDAHSMGFNLLSFCDVRLATAGTNSVVHKVESGEMPPGERWTAKNLRKMADIIDKIDEPYRQRNSKMMNLDLKHYDMYADAENMWTAEQLLAIHYLDGIAKVEGIK